MRATRCECGAVTVEINGEDYSMPAKEFRKHFKKRNLHKTYCCNYCVNHWGIDLCGCGSGEKFGECSANFPSCSRPAQSIEGEITKCSCDSAWA